MLECLRKSKAQAFEFLETLRTVVPCILIVVSDDNK